MGWTSRPWLRRGILTIAALGAKESLIFVVPSLNLVVTRLGEATGEGGVALSSFDNPFLAKVCAAFSINSSIFLGSHGHACSTGKFHSRNFATSEPCTASAFATSIR